MEREYELIRGCKDNNQRSQTALYEMFRPQLTNFIKSRMKDPECIDEIVSMVFTRAFKKIEQYEYKGSFGGWLIAITRHCMYEYINNVNADRTIMFVDDINDHDFGADRVVFSHSHNNEGESNMILNNHLDIINETLTERERFIFMLYYEGYRHREIADMLGITEGTSKWTVNQARNKLKIRISKESLLNSK